MPRLRATQYLRIVSLAPNATSILCRLGSRPSLVGVTRWCADVAPVNHLPKFGDCWNLESIPQVLKLKPDLVIGSVPFKTETLGKLLEQPVRFLALNPRSLSDIEEDIRVVAGLVGRDLAAMRVIADMRKEFVKIRPKSQGKNRLRVYCEAWPNPRITSPPWVAELVDICGAKFVGSPGARISEEDVAAANPDIVVLAWAATGDRAKSERCYQVAAWKEVAAIKNRRVFVIKDELLNTPAPILTRGARQLAKVLSICSGQMLRRS